MKFCPSCEIRLKKGDSASLTCPQCGYVEGNVETVQKGDTSSTIAATATIKKEDKEQQVSELNILDEDEGKETLPTIKILCEKCGHDEAVWWMLQTRSADEATTQFYRCVKCNHTWRNYD